MAKRRPSGDGMVRKRDDGRWEGRIVVGHKENGAPIFRYVSARTQKALLEKLHKNMDEYDGAELNENSRMSLGTWLDIWLEECAAPSVRPSTLRGYRRYVDYNIKPHLGAKQICKVTTADVQRMYCVLQKEGGVNGGPLAASSVRRIHNVLHQAMDVAVSRHLIVKNPTKDVVLPKKEPPVKTILNDAQLERFMEAIQQDAFWHDFFYLELTTGMRRGEILALTWDDLNFETGELQINKQLTPVGGKNIICEPKTKAGCRTIILPPAMLEILKEYKKGVFSHLMFPSRLKPDQPIDPSHVRKRLQQILEHACCRKVRFHDLRHTFATIALEHGMDIKTLSTIIGHSSSGTTLNIYTHITNEMQENAAVSIDRGIVKAEPVVEDNVEAKKATPFVPYTPPRRRPGTGYVKEIKPGLWEGRYSPVWPDGKKHSRNVYGHSREECEEKLDALILQMKAEIAALRSGTVTDYPDEVSLKKKAIAAYLRENPSVTSKTYIAKQLGMDRGTVRKYYDEIRAELAQA